MVTLKCKMCGGTLQVQEGSNIAECMYCGTKQTIPKIDDEKKRQLFDRANLYRLNNEFDKASAVYEYIINDYPREAEAYWGVCLCRYGIEYVVDSRTNRRIPTCHRAQFKSILDDEDYKKACENADALSAQLYYGEAQYIDSVQKNILAISSREDPFDVFICYKETDELGGRTRDSIVANFIYNELTNLGYKVFYSRVTLAEKLGTAYEPYIFSALNSAKVMLAIATKPEYYQATWVKNEWSRYLSLIEGDRTKTLIPCFCDMTPEDMPSEFAPLQALDISVPGYMEGLSRNLSKLLMPQGQLNSPAPGMMPQYEPEPEYKEDLISHIVSVGGNDENNPWPNGAVSAILNKDMYSVVSFQAHLYDTIDYEGTAILELKVMDELDNLMLQCRDEIYVTPDCDTLAKLWILRGSDGSYVQNGVYKAIMSVDDCLPKEYKFKVVSNSGF